VNNENQRSGYNSSLNKLSMGSSKEAGLSNAGFSNSNSTKKNSWNQFNFDDRFNIMSQKTQTIFNSDYDVDNR